MICVKDLKPGDVFQLYGATYVFAANHPPRVSALFIDKAGIIKGHTYMTETVMVTKTDDVVIVLPKEVTKFLKSPKMLNGRTE